MVTEKMLREARKVLEPLDHWDRNCHGASFALVNAELWTCRLARGTCTNVGAQHSWVVIGTDPYDDEADIIDPTLWCYDPEIVGIWGGDASAGLHRPHGKGSIWDWGKPVAGAGEIVQLEAVEAPWSEEASGFLDVLGPLDWDGWQRLTQAPVEGWPAGEILSAIDKQRPLVPIDILGMTTNQNPTGTYIASGHEDEFPRYRGHKS